MCLFDNDSLEVTPTPKARNCVGGYSVDTPLVYVLGSFYCHFTHAIFHRFPQRLALVMKIFILFQITAGALFMATGRYVDGSVDFLSSFLGLMMFGSNAETNSYNLQSTLCFLAFAFVFLFWSLSRGVFFFMGKDQSALLLHGWRADVYEGVVIADVAIYFFMTILAYLLYSELRRILDDISHLAQFLHQTDGSTAYQRLAQVEDVTDEADIEGGRGDSTDKPNSGRGFTLGPKK